MTYQSATDAVFTVDGINFTKDKNSVEISSGLTINLKAVGTSQIQVSIDTEATIQKVQNFVKAYNDAIEYINQKNAYDPSKNTAQPLRLTQADERTLEQIRNKIFSYSVNENGNIWKLSAFGIKTEKSGKLVIDVNELKKAIEQNPDKIAALAHQIGDGAGNPTTGISVFYNPTSSAFQSAINNFGDQSRQLGEKIEKELMALNQEQLRLQNQFSRLNRLQQQLAQALSSLQSFQTSPF
ncbi:MAG: flagellar filament capping protein FliD, partial [Deltaproteobacteria bacterium]|nr:flagellar filament capping protein FliD [Deltaproteobacteria bacterium]